MALSLAMRVAEGEELFGKRPLVVKLGLYIMQGKIFLVSLCLNGSKLILSKWVAEVK